MAVGRRERILSMINARGLISLKELEHTFSDVSSMTLRRDLQYLDDRGEVIRVRRGARAVRSQSGGEVEPVFAMRMMESVQEKEAVATATVPLIKAGQTIYIDAGTTCVRLARKMPDAAYNVVTHAPNIAIEIAKFQFPGIFLLGGRLLKSSLATTGHTAVNMLESFNIDLAIICPAGYTPGVGFTCGDQGECELKRIAMGKAQRTALLMDQNKIGKSLPLTFAKASDIDVMIIDGPIRSDEAKKMLEEMNKMNIEIIIAQEEAAT